MCTHMTHPILSANLLIPRPRGLGDPVLSHDELELERKASAVFTAYCQGSFIYLFNKCLLSTYFV